MHVSGRDVERASGLQRADDLRWGSFGIMQIVCNLHKYGRAPHFFLVGLNFYSSSLFIFSFFPSFFFLWYFHCAKTSFQSRPSLYCKEDKPLSIKKQKTFMLLFFSFLWLNIKCRFMNASVCATVASVAQSVTFLVACTRLYTPLCPSVRRLVGWLVGWSGSPSHFYFYYQFYFFKSI